MKYIIVWFFLAFMAQGAIASTSESTGKGEATSVAEVYGDQGNVSRSITNVFPAPVAPGVIKSPECVRSGVRSAAIGWNLFSFSVPEHVTDEDCRTEALLVNLIKTCQFYSAEFVRWSYLKKAYPEIELDKPNKDVVKNVPFSDCFKKIEKQDPLPPTPPIEQKPPQEAKKPIPGPVVIGGSVWFSFDSAKVDHNAAKIIRDLVFQLPPNADYKVVMSVGHASRVGGAEYNLKLSERRADAVKTELVRLGIPAEKVQVSYRGFTEPLISPERTTKDRDINQRVDIRIELN